jgi:hypothetical protein
MRIGRAIIIPAVLALGVAGSVLTGSAISVAATHAPRVHVQSGTDAVKPDIFLHTGPNIFLHT